MSKYLEFWIKGYEWRLDEEAGVLLLELYYSFDGVVDFTEKLSFPGVTKEMVEGRRAEMERAMGALAMIGGISYYKAYCPAKIVVKMGYPGETAEFWTKVYQNGLGEFFYKNKLDFRGMINFEFEASVGAICSDVSLRERAVLPLGGGKDSLVSADILERASGEFVTFSLRDAEPIRLTAEVIGRPRIVIGREMDAGLFCLNVEGAYNGHVPITGYISFLLVIVALVYDYRYLVLSLEKSANIGQVEYLGMEINHQYSKSEEFENDFRGYIGRYVAQGVEYFSLLRGFYEIRIARIFAGLGKFDRYAGICTSCNANFKIIKDKSPSLWCGHCPKCVFVFSILAPFVEKGKLVAMFGKNLFADRGLENLFAQTWGVADMKPFECVGTFEECRVAMWLASQKDEWEEDLIIRKFLKMGAGEVIDLKAVEADAGAVFTLMDTPNVPEFLRLILEKYED